MWIHQYGTSVVLILRNLSLFLLLKMCVNVERMSSKMAALLSKLLTHFPSKFNLILKSGIVRSNLLEKSIFHHIIHLDFWLIFFAVVNEWELMPMATVILLFLVYLQVQCVLISSQEKLVFTKPSKIFCLDVLCESPFFFYLLNYIFTTHLAVLNCQFLLL